MYSKHALLQFDQSASACAHVFRETHPVDSETRAYDVPVDRASFSQASSHTRLMHSPTFRNIALAYKGKHSSICILPVSRELLSYMHCRHTFVRLLSIGKIVRSNSRSTLKRRTTPDEASCGYAHAPAKYACAIDCTPTKVGFLVCLHAKSLERSRFRKNAQLQSKISQPLSGSWRS